MGASATLRRAREAFRRKAWGEACALLSSSGVSHVLGGPDLERLAVSAYLTGQDEVSAESWTAAHQQWLQDDDVPRAVRCAFWLVMQLISAREVARAGGWLATAGRLLSRCDPECAERGLILVLEVRSHLRDGDRARALDAAARASRIADVCADRDLHVFARLTEGLLHAMDGRHAAAGALFDEVMVSVTLADVSPIAVGTVYCAVIEACYEMADVGRAREWTAALSYWCDDQPDLVAFRGHCLVHRAATLRLSGDWPRALAEAESVCGPVGGSDPQLERPTFRSAGKALYPLGAAFYEVAEVHRIRGDYVEAQTAYREASRHGRTPEPGLALLRLAQGKKDVAAASIRRALGEATRRFPRAGLLAAGVEIAIAVGDTDWARQHSDELSRLAAGVPMPFLRALAAGARGRVQLAEGDATSAISTLREAWRDWQDLEMPYQAAETRVLMGLACRALGDHEAAAMELDAARRVFARLGAAPDIARLDALLDRPSVPALTPRELQVLRLIATGLTNGAIARTLAISERTVDRHAANIYTKLDLPSRTAATAWAYEHGLLASAAQNHR